MKDKSIVLFSGGVESTVLLKWLLLNSNIELHVLYIKLKYFNGGITDRYLEQDKIVKKSIKYFKKNYRYFKFQTIDFKVDQDGFEPLDEYLCYSFAGYIAAINNIEHVWFGHFTYCSLTSIQFNKRVEKEYYDKSYIDPFLNFWPNQLLKKDIKIHIPSRDYGGKEMDTFVSKLHAFQYLENDLQKLVRSCFGKEKFCGKCKKCLHYKFYGINNGHY